MRKNAGIFTVVAVVLAFLGLSNLPKAGSGGTVSNGSEKKATPKLQKAGTAKNTGAPVKDGCREIASRLRPLLTGNVMAKDTEEDLGFTLPESCYDLTHKGIAPKCDCSATRDRNEKEADDSTAPTRVEFRGEKKPTFLIAMVPNPISTHLPLSFDRTVEIIQQAAQDNRYQYESSWLPWNEPKDYSSLADEQTGEESQDDQEKQPGVLIFRSSSNQVADEGGEGGLVVFVVSELPTGGINQEEFDNATEWMQQLGGLSKESEIKILGPSFSGSMVSLYRSLQYESQKFTSNKPIFRIFSGSVSSTEGYDWLQQRLDGDKSKNHVLGTFRTAMEGDSTQIDAFL